jgi:hypothetical protein
MPTLDELARIAREARAMAQSSLETLKQIREELELARRESERARRQRVEAREIWGGAGAASPGQGVP